MINDLGSQDPSLYNIYLNDLADVVVPTPLDGMILSWSDASGWIAIPFSSITGAANSVDGLTDANITAATTGQAFVFNGLEWVNSGLLLSNITNVGAPASSGQALIWNGVSYVFANPTGVGANTLSALTDITLTNIQDGQGIVYKGTISKYANAFGIFSPTGLVGDASTLNTTILQAALNQGGYVYLPTGVYKTEPLDINRNNTVFFGHGTLLVQTGYQQNAILSVSGSNCRVEGITLDGNRYGGFDKAVGRGEGIRLAGARNTLLNIKVVNLPTGGSANGIMVFSNNNLIQGCFVSGGGFSNYYCNGDYNTFRDCISLDYHTKGFTFNGNAGGPVYNSLIVDGFYVTRSTMTGTYMPVIGDTFLLDPGPSTGQMIQRVSLNNLNIGESGPTTSAVFKAAKIRRLNITNSTFRHGSDQSSMKFVEQIDSLTIDNCWIARHINFDSTPKDVTITNCRFGDMPWESRGLFNTISFTGGTHHNPQSHIFDLNVSGTAIIRNCDFYGFTIAGIDLNGRSQDYSPTGYSTLVIENCNFGGSGASVAPIQVTDGGLLNSSRRFIYKNNTVNNFQNGGVTVYCMSGSTAINTYNRLFQQANDSANEYFHASAPLSPNISWQVGDRILNTGTQNLGGNIGWICIASGAPGTWVTYGDLGNKLQQSYLTGTYDVTYNGVTNTGADVTTSIKTLFSNIPNNTTLRFPAGDYYLSDTILLSGKNNLYFDIAPNARFIETKRLGSGTFIFNRCSGITWQGGIISGADTLTFILAMASGVEFSGSSIENLGPGVTDSGASVRYVLGQWLSTEHCGNIVLKDTIVLNKYRAWNDYASYNVLVDNVQHYGVHRGILSRLDETIVFGSTGAFPNTGTASAQQGDIYKETERTTYSFSLIKTHMCRLVNCFSENCGGLLNAGTVSLGSTSQTYTENLNVLNCYSHNPYDNGIYLSSIHKALVDGVRVITDRNLIASVTAIKCRGRHNKFVNCYVEYCYNGYGFEGFGSTADYWTDGGSNGWSSEGDQLLNCTAVDCTANGVYTDRNNTIFPRDLLIQGNYFYNCGLGPWGGNPTGYFAGLDEISVVPIQLTDCRRPQIINNTIENTGVVGPDYAMSIGSDALGTQWITGAIIAGNKILGTKNGIHMIRVAHARISDNWGERIGQYGGGPYVTASGYPAMVVADNLKDSRIVNNMLAPTGHCAALYVIPNTTFTNVIRRDNDGGEIIN